MVCLRYLRSYTPIALKMFFSIFNDYFLYVHALNIFAVIKHFAKHGKQLIHSYT